jgi:hypothetical protein
MNAAVVDVIASMCDIAPWIEAVQVVGLGDIVPREAHSIDGVFHTITSIAVGLT